MMRGLGLLALALMVLGAGEAQAGFGMRLSLAPSLLAMAPEGEATPKKGISPEERLRLVERDSKSVALGWALSFFLSLGIGNFYAGAWPNGLGVLVAETVGVITAIIFWPIGVALIAASWVADWILAIYAVRTYNDQVRYHYLHSSAQEFMRAPLL